MNRRRIYFRQSDLEQDRGPCPPIAGESFEDRYGISRLELSKFERKQGVNQLLRKYNLQRRGAWDRGIEWQMTLPEWLEVWGDKIGQRGKGRDCLMMCRKDDKGPYSKDNVRLATPYENSLDSHSGNRLARWGRTRSNYFVQKGPQGY